MNEGFKAAFFIEILELSSKKHIYRQRLWNERGRSRCRPRIDMTGHIHLHLLIMRLPKNCALGTDAESVFSASSLAEEPDC